jgi:hypothetical protein
MKFSLAVLCLLSSVLLRAAEPAITEAELVRRTQELYDSIVSGNQTPWKKYFADDCTFSDERGRTFDKTKLVADITPLPKGIPARSRSKTSSVGSLATPRYSIEGRILFHCDSTGKIDALIDRRNNEDVVWKKTK